MLSRRPLAVFLRRCSSSAAARDAFLAHCEKAKVAPKMAFIGGGNMAQAIYKGFISSGLMHPRDIGVSDPFPAALKSAKEVGVLGFESNDELLSEFGSGVVWLAVKPQVVSGLLAAAATSFQKSSLVVSILAGTSTRTLSELLPGGSSPALVRVMPNTPALVGKGASVVALGQGATQAHGALVQALMATVGTVHEVSESQVDAVTALSGSGPAFVYTIIQALSDGSVENGLPRALADQLAAQTVLGSAEMVVQTGQHTGVLRDAVCSPGGTTIAGVVALEQHGLRNALIKAVQAAYRRAIDLGAYSSK